MLWLNWTALASWFHRMGPELVVVAGAVSVAILFGCAIASWIAPSKKKDRLFHRGVL